MNEQPVSFPQWKAALALAGLSPPQKIAYPREIIIFPKHRISMPAPATTDLDREYRVMREMATSAPAREALLVLSGRHPHGPGTARARQRRDDANLAPFMQKTGLGVRSPSTRSGRPRPPRSVPPVISNVLIDELSIPSLTQAARGQPLEHIELIGKLIDAVPAASGAAPGNL